MNLTDREKEIVKGYAGAGNMPSPASWGANRRCDRVDECGAAAEIYRVAAADNLGKRRLIVPPNEDVRFIAPGLGQCCRRVCVVEQEDDTYVVFCVELVGM